MHGSRPTRVTILAALAGALVGTGALAQPANDLCADAEPVVEGILASGDTTGATGAAEANCSSQTSDVWYALATSGSATYDVTLTSGGPDMSLSAFVACAGGQISGNDGRPACRPVVGGGQSTLTFGGNGATVFIRVSSATPGTFDLLVSSDAPTGACCIDGACEVLTATACGASGGTYLGDDEPCGDGGEVGEPVEIGSSSPFLPIGPGAGVITSDTINANELAPETIGSMTVIVDLNHFFLEDLTIEIEHLDSGVTAILFDQSCGDNDDLGATFADNGGELACGTPTVGTFVPVEALSAFNGLDGFSSWTLRITDNASFEDGTLNFWSVSLAGEAGPTPCDVPTCPCEFGGDPESVDVTDLLGFLALWFVGDAGADLNGGGVDVTDLLEFLACWFPASSGSC